MHAGQRACMVDAGVHAGRERWQVRASVELRDHHRPVHIALDEVDQHLGADARRELRAPVGTGQRLGHAHPGARAVVAGRVALVVGVVVHAAGVGAVAALPGELHFDLVVARGRGAASPSPTTMAVCGPSAVLACGAAVARGTMATVSRTQPKLLR